MSAPFPALEARIHHLERVLRRDRRLASTALVSLLALAFVSWQERAAPAEFDQLTAKRIDIVDEQGRRRIVLACAKRFPLLVLSGYGCRMEFGSAAGISSYGRSQSTFPVVGSTAWMRTNVFAAAPFRPFSRRRIFP